MQWLESLGTLAWRIFNVWRHVLHGNFAYRVLWAYIDLQTDKGYWQTNASGRTKKISKSFARMLGRSESEFFGFGWHALIHEDDRDEVMRVFRLSINLGTNYFHRFRMRKADGTHVRVEAVGIRLNGGYFGSVVEIS